MAGTLERPWILGHESVQGEQTKGASKKPKWDPGPLFPIRSVRTKVFGETPELVLTPFYGECIETFARDSICRDVREATSEDEHEALPDRVVGDAGDTEVLRYMLDCLGYYVRVDAIDELDQEESVSLWIFQRMRGLVTDGVAGPITTAALIDEMTRKNIT